MAVVQKHDLSTLDKVRRTLAWTLFALAAPVVILAALAVLSQILIVALYLLGSWVSNHS